MGIINSTSIFLHLLSGIYHSFYCLLPLFYLTISRPLRDHYGRLRTVLFACFFPVTPPPVDRFPLSFFSTYVTPLIWGANSTKRTGTSSKNRTYLCIRQRSAKNLHISEKSSTFATAIELTAIAIRKLCAIKFFHIFCCCRCLAGGGCLLRPASTKR